MKVCILLKKDTEIVDNNNGTVLIRDGTKLNIIVKFPDKGFGEIESKDIINNTASLMVFIHDSTEGILLCETDGIQNVKDSFSINGFIIFTSESITVENAVDVYYLCDSNMTVGFDRHISDIIEFIDSIEDCVDKAIIQIYESAHEYDSRFIDRLLTGIIFDFVDDITYDVDLVVMHKFDLLSKTINIYVTRSVTRYRIRAPPVILISSY